MANRSHASAVLALISSVDAPTYRDFSRQIALPAGPLAGHKYDPDSDPVQRYLIGQMDSGRWERIYWCAAPQVGGKTQVAVLLPVLHTIIGQGKPCGYGLPTLQDLDKAWVEKLKPAIEGGGFSGHLPTSGSGARGGRGPTLQLVDPATKKREGRLVFLAGGAYGSTVKTVVVDEVDQFRKKDGTPLWEELEDIFHRCDSYKHEALRIAVGTIEHDEKSIIVELCDQMGTGTRMHQCCPYCNAYRQLSFDAIRYDPTDEIIAKESARIICQNCGAALTEYDRQLAISNAVFVHAGQTVDAAGNVLGHPPRTKSLGIISDALTSSLSDLGELAVEDLRAKRALERGEHGLARKFCRYRKCQTYSGDRLSAEEMGAKLTLEHLLSRSSLGWADQEAQTDCDEGGGGGVYSRHWSAWPEGAQYASAAIDVQHNRLYWALIAADDSGRRWDMAHGQEWGNRRHDAMSETETFETLQRTAAVLLSYCGGRPFIGGAVDTGDGNTMQAVLKWLAAAPAGWMPCDGKGDQIINAQHQYDVVGIAYMRTPAGWPLPTRPLMHVASNAVRESVLNSYLVPLGAPGASALPRGGDARNGWIRHLLSKQMEITAAGNRVWRTGKNGGREDWLDCRIYSEAHLQVFRPGRIQQRKQANPQEYLAQLLRSQGRR